MDAPGVVYPITDPPELRRLLGELAAPAAPAELA
jgi:hypothetical protein